MKTILTIYKPLGKTPFEMVKKLKELRPELADKKIGYAGRLDPMAEGVLLLLVGETNKQKKDFELLPKEYTFEVIFGMKTDSYDLLGKVTSNYDDYDFKEIDQQLKKEIKKYCGRFLQTYPPYSAIRLNGKPLYYWELRGLLPKEKIPTKEVIITSLELLSTGTISKDRLHDHIKKTVSLVSGNFRQKEILTCWEDFFRNSKNNFLTAKMHLNCSSGTYVRSIVNDLGEQLGIGATTFSILRTSVGDYSMKDSIIFS